MELLKEQTSPKGGTRPNESKNLDYAEPGTHQSLHQTQGDSER